MTTVAIQEFRDHLKRYLDAVQGGEEVVLTEGGKPVARIVKEPPAAPDRKWRDEAIARGDLRPAQGRMKPGSSHPVELPGKPLSEIIIEDRG
jgi:prevent-host-death family protein